MRREVARATVALAVAHAAQAFTSLASLALLTEALGPEGYGALATVVAAYVVLGGLTDLGTGVVAVKSMAQRPDEAGRDLVAVLRLRLLLGLVAAAVGTVAFATRSGPERVAGLVGAGFPLAQAWSSSRLLLQARLEDRRLVVGLLAGRAVQLFLVALVAHAGAREGLASLLPAALIRAAGSGAAPAAAVLALVVGELVTAGALRLSVAPLPRVARDEVVRRATTIAREAAPLALGFVLAQVTQGLDVILLAALRTREEAAFYALAERPLGILEPLPRLLLWSALPLLARGAARAPAARDAAPSGEPDLASAYREAVGRLALAAFPIAFGIVLVGPSLLALVVDARFEQAGAPLALLGFATACTFLEAPAETGLVAVGLTRVSLAASALGLVVNVAANLTLIPRLGAVGAAWAWLLTAGATLLARHVALALAITRRSRLEGRALAWAIARPLAAASVMYAGLGPALPGFAARHPCAAVGVGVVLHAAGYLALGGLSRTTPRP